MTEIHRAGNVGPELGERDGVLLGGGGQQLVVADPLGDPRAAGADKRVLHTEAACLGDTPRVHVLAPDLVPVAGLPLQHRDPEAPFRGRLGECAACDPAPDDNDVGRVLHVPALPA